jgi:hypothetical protein
LEASSEVTNSIRISDDRKLQCAHKMPVDLKVSEVVDHKFEVYVAI